MTWVGSSGDTYKGLAFFIIVSAITYWLLPRFLNRQTGTKTIHKRLLVIGLILLPLSELLPSPLIEGRDTQFSTHFVGGGLFTGFLWLYLYKNLRFKFSWLVELASLYALVSSLGVANELMELFGDKIGVFNINPSDTWWDLLANTLGAFSFWAIYKLTTR